MDDMTTFERLISRAATMEVGPPRPVDAESIVRSAATAEPASRRSLTTRRRAGSTAAASPQPLFSLSGATKFVLAGVIVALFGGFLLAGLLTTRQADEPLPVGASASPETASLDPVRLPAELPADVPSGRLDSPLGPARWVHLQGGPDDLPRSMHPLPAPLSVRLS